MLTLPSQQSNTKNSGTSINSTQSCRVTSHMQAGSSSLGGRKSSESRMTAAVHGSTGLGFRIFQVFAGYSPWKLDANLVCAREQPTASVRSHARGTCLDPSRHLPHVARLLCVLRNIENLSISDSLGVPCVFFVVHNHCHFGDRCGCCHDVSHRLSCAASSLCFKGSALLSNSP